MKRAFIFVLSLTLTMLACSVFQRTATPIPPTSISPSSTAPDILDTPWEDRSLFRAGLIDSAKPVVDELTEASIYHLELNIAEDLYHVTGTEQVRYTNTEEVALEQVYFRLFPNVLGGEMDISNLTVDEQPVTPSYEMADSLMIVPLSSPLEPGQSLILRMDFRVTVPDTVELNYGLLAYFQDVLALAHAYPMIAVYDDEGWNAEIPPQSGDVVYADVSFFLVRVTAPKDVTLVTTGHEVSSEESGEWQTISVASGPARDFYLAASPIYQEISRTFGEVTIRSYAPEDLKEGSELAIDVASRAIDDFNARYAPFPYSEFDIVMTPTLALGIEYPGMVAITSRIYDLNQLVGNAPARVYLESTVAHEVGHQWFYNLVGDDQLDDPWLDESLTQYATLQYYRDEYGESGESGFENALQGRWSEIEFEKIPVGLPVADYSGKEYGAIVYGRGALFFVALREEMGTEAFDAFLKEYTETLSWKIATPEILQSLAEEHCGCDLDALFNEWIYP